MPMILATCAVHSQLTRKGLRTFCSLNVRSAECIDPHYFAVLIGCGRDHGERLSRRGQPSPTGSSAACSTAP